MAYNVDHYKEITYAVVPYNFIYPYEEQKEDYSNSRSAISYRKKSIEKRKEMLARTKVYAPVWECENVPMRLNDLIEYLVRTMEDCISEYQFIKQYDTIIYSGRYMKSKWRIDCTTKTITLLPVTKEPVLKAPIIVKE